MAQSQPVAVVRRARLLTRKELDTHGKTVQRQASDRTAGGGSITICEPNLCLSDDQSDTDRFESEGYEVDFQRSKGPDSPADTSRSVIVQQHGKLVMMDSCATPQRASRRRTIESQGEKEGGMMSRNVSHAQKKASETACQMGSYLSEASTCYLSELPPTDRYASESYASELPPSDRYASESTNYNFSQHKQLVSGSLAPAANM